MAAVPFELNAPEMSAQKIELPPLILHPFAEKSSPGRLLASSRASLALQGLLPEGSSGREELDRTVLEGRLCELRMLFYVGRDAMRWIGQCCEFAGRNPASFQSGVEPQSFAALLVNHTPESVRDKLHRWGVADFRSIFSRAIGLNAVLLEPPDPAMLTEEFLRNYHCYADQFFACWLQQKTFAELRSAGFHFELFASAEYSRMLENEWGEL